MHSKGVINGYLKSEIAPKSQKVIQKNHLEGKLGQKRSGKILRGGFLLSQLSPVRREMRLPGGSWPWENPWTPAIRLRLIANREDRSKIKNKKADQPKRNTRPKGNTFQFG